MAHIKEHQQKNGKIVYRVRFRLDGNKNPVVETFDTIQDAQKFADLIDRVGGVEARKIRDAATNNPNTITLTQALDAYLEHVDSYAARGTAPEYRRTAQRTWLPRLGNYPITAITREHVTAWVKWQRTQPTRHGTPPAPKTLKNAHSILSQVLQYYIDLGELERNPAKGVKIPRDIARQPATTFLTKDEYSKIIENLDPYYVPLVHFLYLTGARFGEATAIPVGALNLDEKPATVRIWRAWKKDENQGRYLGTPKTRKSNRTISLPQSLAKILQEIVKDRKLNELVFVNKQNKPVDVNSFRRHVWQPAVRRAGISKRPRVHDLRHTHASNLIAEGVPLPVIQDRLGHESIQTTVDTYGHLADSAKDKVADILNNLM